MKRIKKGKRLLAVALSMLLAFGGLPTAALAEGQPVQATQGLCEHHLEHTADCGYGEGQPCEHKVNGGGADREGLLGGEHLEDCYTNELICGYKVNGGEADREGGLGRDEEKETTASDSDAEHTHTQECYALDCPHECGKHDADCGYAEAQPCGYTCELCGKTDNEPEPKPGDETEQAVCDLTEGCTLPDGHEGECVTEPGEGEKETACALTEGCTLPDGHEGECATELPPANDALAKIITSWTFVATDYSDYTGNEFAMPGASMERQANFDTMVSMLPTGISAEIEGEAEPAQVDITGWSCPEYVQDENGNWPVTGEYVFTAKLRSGYACDPLPTVKALLGGTELYASPATVGAFTVTGDASQYEWKDPVLTIKSGATLTIQNTDPSTPTPHRIKVAENATNVNITLAGVNINVSSKSLTDGRDACAFDMTKATVNLTLAAGSNNILNSNSLYAGLEVPAGANLTIDGSGTLKSMSYNGDGNGAGIGGGNSERGSNGGKITIQGSAQVTATGGNGAGIGGGNGGNGGEITIQGGAQVTATSNYGAGIGGGNSTGLNKGNGGNVIISGQNTHVTVKSSGARDIGGGFNGTDGGSLSVTDGATLEMQNGGTNAKNPVYRNCTLIDGGGNRVQYDNEGKAISTLSLEASPAGSLTLPGSVTLTATLSGAAGGLSGKTITFSGSGTHTSTTDASGEATYTFTNLTPGTYSFGASFAGDGDNKSASAAEISGYTVSRGAQDALSLIGLDNAYTYGDEPFGLSTSGGSSGGAVSYQSSDTAVASVTGDQVTLLKAGTFTITATKAGDANYDEVKVTSGTVTVNPATPGISLTATGGANINDPIVLTATVSKIGTGATPTGTATFKEGNTILAENVALDGSGKATCTVSNLTAGNHTYTAAYSGQSGYYNSASADRTVGVGLADQTGFAITDPGAKTYGDSAFTLTAAGGQSSGEVSYSAPDGNGVLTVAADGKVTITGAGKVTVTATKAGDNDYNQATVTLEITVAPRDIANVTVNVTGSRVYTGSQLQPVFEVKDGSTAITTGDYTNEYGSNVDTGANTGSIKLTGQRNYTGAKTVTFDIEKRSLTGAVITLEFVTHTHTNSEIKPAVTSVVVDAITVPAAEFDVEYANNTAVGTATVTVTAKADGNFSGTAITTFDIEKRSLTGAAITLEFVTHTHTNREIKPSVTSVVVDGITVPAAEFDVEYANNTAVGTATVTVTAKADGNFSGKASTTFEITKSNSSSGGGGGGSSNSSNGSSVTTQTPQSTADDPNSPTVGEITPSVTVDKDGKVTISVSDRDIQSAIDKATAQAKKDGTLANGIAVSIDLTGLKTQFNTRPLTLSRTVYQKLADAGVNSMSIASPQISLSLDLETLKTIYTNATGNVTINAVKAENSKLPAGMQNRPAYDLTIVSGGKQISDFGKGNIAVTLPYTLQGTEQGGSLQMAYVDTEGKARNMTNSSYHANQSAMIGRTNHFTVFGIVQKPVPAFNDIEGHWANDDILFVASRELLSGTGNNLFSPDTGMTRGMFVTALGRLAGIDQTQYKNTKFSDVAATAYYAPYVAWAAEKGIVNGTTDTTFAPDTNISREQMAVIMQNYALACGYTVPKTREAVTFADSSSIESWAKDAVKAMQMAGVMNGKDGNRFDPKASATRAEVSAVLRRFVEIVIDPATAAGWEKNDSGHWLYYKDSKALTGWKEIGGKWYYFDENGVMTVNTRIDGYEVGPDGARKKDL